MPSRGDIQLHLLLPIKKQVASYFSRIVKIYRKEQCLGGRNNFTKGTHFFSICISLFLGAFAELRWPSWVGSG